MAAVRRIVLEQRAAGEHERAAVNRDRAARRPEALDERGFNQRGAAAHAQRASLVVRSAGTLPRAIAHAQLAALNLDGAVERQPNKAHWRRAGEHLEQRRVTDGAQLGAARALDPQLARVEVPVDDERGGMVAGGELKHNNLAL